MLGFEREHKPISGIYAKRLRDTLRRIETGDLNRSDCLMLKFELEKPKYDIEWVDEKLQHLNPTQFDMMLQNLSDSLSEYIVIVNNHVKFDFSKISKQMKFLKGYGKALSIFRNTDKTQLETILTHTDNNDGNEDGIVEASKSMLLNLFQEDIKKKRYVYVSFNSVNADKKDNKTIVSLKWYRMPIE